MHHQIPMKDCITRCWECRQTCQDVFYNHCLQHGGEHVASAHAKLMLECISICQLSADFMVQNSPYHHEICRVCAIICTACSESCSKIDTDEMKRCAEVCKRCAESCHEMGLQAHTKS